MATPSNNQNQFRAFVVIFELAACLLTVTDLEAATARQHRTVIGEGSVGRPTHDGAVLRSVMVPDKDGHPALIAVIDWTAREIRLKASGSSSLSVGEIERLLPQAQARADLQLRELFEQAVIHLPLSSEEAPLRQWQRSRQTHPSAHTDAPLQNIALRKTRIGYPARALGPPLPPSPTRSDSAFFPMSEEAGESLMSSATKGVPGVMDALHTAVGHYQAEQTTFLASGGLIVEARLALDGSKEGLGEFWAVLRRLSASETGGLTRSSLLAQDQRPQLSRSPARPSSGLVIQAKGLGARPCLLPRLFDRDGGLLFGADTIESSIYKTRGVAAFSTSLEAALRDPRVAEQATVVRAIERIGDGCADLVIDESDLPEHTQLSALLDDARVIIVLDDPSSSTHP